MDIVIGLLYLVGFLAVVLGIGFGIGFLLRRRGVARYQELLRHGVGWRQVPADPQLWQQVRALREFSSSRGLKDFFHMAGEHRQTRFEVVQYQRPPGVGQRMFVSGTAVILPRPVPGAEIRLAEASAWGRLGQDLVVPVGHEEFDRRFLLTSTDAGLARGIMHPGLVDSLARDQRMAGRVVEFAPNHVIVFGGVVASKETVLPMLDLLLDIHGSVPWRNLAG